MKRTFAEMPFREGPSLCAKVMLAWSKHSTVAMHRINFFIILNLIWDESCSIKSKGKVRVERFSMIQ